MIVKKVLFGSLGCVLQFKKELLKALLIPILAFFIIDAVIYYYPTSSYLYLVILLSLLMQTILAVVTHRVILLGPKSVPRWGLKKWTMRETKFTLYFFGIGLYIVPLVLFSLIPYVGFAIFILGACYVIGRLSLIFPAIAVEDDTSFKQSWEQTKNYQLLMVLVVVIIPILGMLPGKLFEYLPYGYILSSIFSIIATVFFIACLSVTYRVIKEASNES